MSLGGIQSNNMSTECKNLLVSSPNCYNDLQCVLLVSAELNGLITWGVSPPRYSNSTCTTCTLHWLTLIWLNLEILAAFTSLPGHQPAHCVSTPHGCYLNFPPSQTWKNMFHRLPGQVWKLSFTLMDPGVQPWGLENSMALGENTGNCPTVWTGFLRSLSAYRRP